MRQTSRIVLGLDGGGTKTVCVAVPNEPLLGKDAADVVPLARVEVGSTNRNSVGAEQAHVHLEQAVEQTLQAAGRERADVDAICLGMSGVDRPEDLSLMNGWLQEMLPGVPAFIYNDAVIALASGTRGQLYGVVLISGTGMIAMGFNRSGERRRAGGGGALLGDGGSGYAIGAGVLRAVTWAADGRSPQTTLTELTLRHLNMQRVQQLVRWTYDDISWRRIAQLAPLALHAANAGDPAAVSIVRNAATELALAAESVARRLRILSTPFPLVLAGGILRSGILADRLQERFRRTLPNATIVHPAVEPTIGAAMLAIQSKSATA